MGVFRQWEVCPKFYLRICCIVCNILLYCSAIYRESIVYGTDLCHRSVQYNLDSRYIAEQYNTTQCQSDDNWEYFFILIFIYIIAEFLL